ncbi:hypothetical protein OH76DRAFT_1483772 [Lentinus brumalis]|uniref:Uncharacterized protein n=1 Tax=Lentinus brumalis TaxID=2498619 RepID=A0A371D849_9APHY|nr:hypothetical protein OH76DRAFT_1483772 [Polyporus brumalis]
MAIQSQPPPFTCPRCTHLHEDEHVLDDRVLLNYVPGDILKLKESVHAVVYDEILAAAAQACGLSSYVSPSNALHAEEFKGRPAIVMRRRPKAQGGTAVVCLCGTFWGKSRRARLPALLRHFCVTMHPHEAIPFEPHQYHIHTKPEWTVERAGKHNGWVIAVIYPSSGDIVGRWPNKARSDEQSSSSFTIADDHNTRRRYQETCDQKWRDFMVHCSLNPTAFEVLHDDYEEWRNNKLYHAGNTTASTSIVSDVRAEERTINNRKGKGKAREKPSETPQANANHFAVLAAPSSMNSCSSNDSSEQAEVRVTDLKPTSGPSSKPTKSRRRKRLMSLAAFLNSGS